MPWSYLVALKDYRSRSRWYRNAAEIEVQLQKRLRRTKSGKSPLLYFDASTMMGYQLPPKAWETLYCRREDRPSECDELVGFHPELVAVPIFDVEIKKSTIGEFAGRGLFAVHDIPRGTCIGLTQDVQNIHILPTTLSLIHDMDKLADGNGLSVIADSLSIPFKYINGYGFVSLLLVSKKER